MSHFEKCASVLQPLTCQVVAHELPQSSRKLNKINKNNQTRWTLRDPEEATNETNKQKQTKKETKKETKANKQTNKQTNR